MIALFTGLVAGSAHVLAGPDHLAALAPVAADDPSRAFRLGVRWGLGHGAGVVALGLLGLVARNFVNIDALSAWSEFFVGFILLAVGMWAFRKASKIVVHSHGHGHEDDDHAHYHVHTSAERHDAPEAHTHHAHTAFWVGVLHGAAGAGHLFGVLPSLALPRGEAIVYLCAYFAAAVVSMGAFGAVMGFLVKDRSPRIMRGVMYLASVSAMGIGVVWLGNAWPV